MEIFIAEITVGSWGGGKELKYKMSSINTEVLVEHYLTKLENLKLNWTFFSNGPSCCLLQWIIFEL